MAKRMVYARFQEFFANWWGASPSTYYRVVGSSLSGASRYIEMNGKNRQVPTAVLTFQRWS